MDDADDLVLNPHVEMKVVGPPAGPSCVVVSTARRGMPRTVTSVTPSADFDVFPLLLRIAGAREPQEIPLTDEQTAFLEQVGILVDPEIVPGSARFAPRLDAALLAAVPRRERALTMPSLSSLVRAPGVVVQWNGDVPADLPPPVREALSRRGVALEPPIVWVRDAHTQVWCPYECDPALALDIERTGPGAPVRGALEPITVDLLVRAQILVPATIDPGSGPASPRDRHRAAFVARDHAVIGQMLPSLQVAALRSYYAARVREGYFGLGDSLVERRYVAHNEPVARLFLAQLAPLVSSIVGEPVKPSYVFFARYLPGAVLPKHVDREQCEYSISFQIDYSPEPDDVSPWPLFLENAGSPDPIAVHLGLGDGLLYLGRRQPHHRRRLPKGHSSTSLFFHFVREDFDGTLD